MHLNGLEYGTLDYCSRTKWCWNNHRFNYGQIQCAFFPTYVWQKPNFMNVEQALLWFGIHINLQVLPVDCVFHHQYLQWMKFLFQEWTGEKCSDDVCFVRRECLFWNSFSEKGVITWFSCFRIAAMVVIALSRMHYLVRRWRLGHRIGSNAGLSRGISESTLSSTLSLYHGELQILVALRCSVASFKTFVAYFCGPHSTQ
jgi:hypothetical protein